MAAPVATPTPPTATPPVNVGGAPAAPVLTAAQLQAVRSNILAIPLPPVPTPAPPSAEQVAALTQQLVGMQTLVANSRRTLVLPDGSTLRRSSQ